MDHQRVLGRRLGDSARVLGGRGRHGGRGRLDRRVLRDVPPNPRLGELPEFVPGAHGGSHRPSGSGPEPGAHGGSRRGSHRNAGSGPKPGAHGVSRRGSHRKACSGPDELAERLADAATYGAAFCPAGGGADALAGAATYAGSDRRAGAGSIAAPDRRADTGPDAGARLPHGSAGLCADGEAIIWRADAGPDVDADAGTLQGANVPTVDQADPIAHLLADHLQAVGGAVAKPDTAADVEPVA